jgi:hypothetical protein
MTGHGFKLVTRGLATAITAALAFMSAHEGGGGAKPAEVRPNGDRKRAEIEAAESNVDAAAPPREDRAEAFAEMLGRSFRMLGVQADAVRERIEGYYGIYRLLRTLGLSDQEIAALVAQQARTRVERELRGRTLTAAETRRALDGVSETVVRAAEGVDERLNLGGEFVRRVRDGVQASKAGREDVLIGLDRGLAAAREQLRKVLKNSD